MITYRTAGAADAGVLRRFLQALADHDGGGAVGSEASLRLHGFGPNPLFRAHLAERDGAPVGMVLFYPDYSTQRGEPGVYVQDIYVADDCRGMGLGRGLLAEAHKAAAAWGAGYMTLGVGPQNLGARRFYAGLGFRPRGYEFLILDGAELETLR